MPCSLYLWVLFKTSPGFWGTPLKLFCLKNVTAFERKAVEATGGPLPPYFWGLFSAII